MKPSVLHLDEATLLANCKLFRLQLDFKCDLKKHNKPLYISPHFTIPVGSVVPFGIVSVGTPVGSDVIILHTT